MALSKAMLLILKAFSHADDKITNSYKVERTVKKLKEPIVNPYKKYSGKIISGSREVEARVYLPGSDDILGSIEPRDLILFFHGGGWVTESIDTYNRTCSELADATGAQVVSVEYKLAPEHPFPQGLKDCYAAAKEIILNSGKRVTILGDSAGGNLAAAVSLMARDKGEFKVERQILLYPAVNNDYSENSRFASVKENGFDYILTAKRMAEYMKLYQSSEEDLNNPYFAPILADSFENQPKTLVITSELDLLRDEGEEYARRLYAAGNSVKLYRMKDALHGFISLGAKNPYVKRTHSLINEFLKSEF